MDLIGNLHPLLLHLPIGILLYVFVHWSYERWLVKKAVETDHSFALFLGALTAIFSAVSGWLLARGGGYDEQLLQWHQNLGIITAVGTMPLLWLYRRRPENTGFTIYFFAFIGLLTATGHYGGSLTHGEGFLTHTTTESPGLSADQLPEAQIFEELVMPIIERKCVSCHNPQKAKGELLLNSLAGWQRGGENGPILQAGLAAESALITRVSLPKEDELHMPPAGKLQLSNEERNFLRWWIENMEHYEHQLQDLQTTPEVDKYLASLLESDQPDVDRPTLRQLAALAEYGFVANLQSEKDPWLTVELAQADSFDTRQLKRLRPIAAAVQTLDLSHAQFSEGNLSALRHCVNLKHLNLSHSEFESEALAVLEDFPQLETLNLYGTGVSASLFDQLITVPNLERLYLGATAIANEEIKQAQGRFPELEIIQGVDFEQFGEQRLVPPFIVAEQDLFTDTLLISLETKASRAHIHYTVDGSNPRPTSAIYEEPFLINNTSEVRAILSMDGWLDSEPVSRTFAKSRYAIASIRANTKPNEKYEAEGLATLSDLSKGSSTFSDGKWLGFYGEDVQLIIDLGQRQEISGVTIGTLSDFNSYIHLPKSIRIQTSVDGRRYTPFQEKRINIPEEPTAAQVFNHLLRAEVTQARYLRIQLESQGVNPAWHPVPGATCWLFLDEVLVE